MIGERLREVRKENGYTQQRLANILSVSKYTISAYENGKSSPDDKNLILIAKEFNISLDYLMGLVDRPVPYKRDCKSLSLPEGFDKQQIDDVLDYIEYLKFCSKKQARN